MATVSKKGAAGGAKKPAAPKAETNPAPGVVPPPSPDVITQVLPPAGDQATNSGETKQVSPPASDKAPITEQKPKQKEAKSYKAKTSIEHNGKLYGVGDPISFDDEAHVNPLLDVDAIEEASGE